MTRTHGKKPLPPKLRAKLARYAREGWIVELLSGLRTGMYELVEVPEEQRRPLPVPQDDNMDAFVAAVLAVGSARREMLDRLRAALQGDDQATALAIARQLVHMEEQKTRNRVN